MKQLLTSFVLIGIALTSQAQKHQLTKLWETDSTLQIPESVFPDPKQNVLYVSIINGVTSEADGNGSIAKVGTDGKIINTSWVPGLNSPKGMAHFGNKLYVGDLTELVVIDIPSGKVDKKIKIPNTKTLNDVTVDGKGVIYVSDSGTGTIYKVEKDVPTVFLENLKAINGVRYVGSNLYLVSETSFYKTDDTKKLTKIADGLSTRLDGIEPVNKGDFLITSWLGVIHYVKADGTSEILLDTQAQSKNTADLGFDPGKSILYVPTFNKKSVVAYQLK